MTIIGCDPGMNGALAIVDSGRLVGVFDMPTLTITVSGKNRRVVDENILAVRVRDTLAAYPGAHFVLEEVASQPQDGSVGAFAFGRGYGAIRGVIAALSIPRTHIRPAEWKRALKMRKGKDASRQRAMELFPEWCDWFGRVRDDGRAEAALIAYWYAHHGRPAPPINSELI